VANRLKCRRSPVNDQSQRVQAAVRPPWRAPDGEGVERLHGPLVGGSRHPPDRLVRGGRPRHPQMGLRTTDRCQRA
jgi:hypothetical protein